MAQFKGNADAAQILERIPAACLLWIDDYRVRQFRVLFVVVGHDHVDAERARVGDFGNIPDAGINRYKERYAAAGEFIDYLPSHSIILVVSEISYKGIDLHPGKEIM